MIIQNQKAESQAFHSTLTQKYDSANLQEVQSRIHDFQSHNHRIELFFN